MKRCQAICANSSIRLPIEAEVLSGCRNDIVHALWWLDPMDRHSPVSSRRINPMKGQDLPPEHPTPNAQDIEALAVSMSECADRLL